MLNCHIVKDLLPNYIDGLLSKETEQEVQQHLQSCDNCQSLYNQMESPLAPIIIQDEKEIDYLKKIKRKSQKVVKYSVISVAIIAIVFVSICVIALGTPVKSADLNYAASITEANTVQIELSPQNGSAFSVGTKVTYNETTGQMTELIISPRKVPEWFPNSNGSYFGYEYTPDNGLSENFQIVIKLSDKNIVLTADDLEN